MRTNIGPRTKRSTRKQVKKPARKPAKSSVKPTKKRKLFGGVKGGRRKADPNAAKRAHELREIRKLDWIDHLDDDDENLDQLDIETDDDSPSVVVDSNDCCDDELAQITREIEGDFESIDTDAVNVLKKTSEFLSETEETANFSNKGKKSRSSRIPAEVAKNLAAFHFFNEDESKKKDAEFDINAIISVFRIKHKWYDDSEKNFKTTAKRFFGNHKYVSAIITHFILTIEEFMKLFVGKYVEQITPDIVRNDIVPCVAKVKTRKMTPIEAKLILSTED